MFWMGHIIEIGNVLFRAGNPHLRPVTCQIDDNREIFVVSDLGSVKFGSVAPKVNARTRVLASSVYSGGNCTGDAAICGAVL